MAFSGEEGMRKDFSVSSTHISCFFHKPKHQSNMRGRINEKTWLIPNPFPKTGMIPCNWNNEQICQQMEPNSLLLTKGMLKFRFSSETKTPDKEVTESSPCLSEFHLSTNASGWIAGER